MLIEYAEEELRRAEVGASDADYNGEIAGNVMDLVKVFAGHDGSEGSNEMTLMIFNKLVHFEPLSPLTNDPTEWNDVSEDTGKPMWQSRRDPKAFSTDGGQTWYRLGATGNFPEGKYNEADEGEIGFHIGVDLNAQVIVFDLGKPVAWLGMKAADARELAAMLLAKAEDLDGITKTAVASETVAPDHYVTRLRGDTETTD